MSLSPNSYRAGQELERRRREKRLVDRALLAVGIVFVGLAVLMHLRQLRDCEDHGGNLVQGFWGTSCQGAFR